MTNTVLHSSLFGVAELFGLSIPEIPLTVHVPLEGKNGLNKNVGGCPPL